MFYKIVLLLTIVTSMTFAETSNEEVVFKANLKEMAERIDKSVELLREQISENQSAPFLGDLYLQLGQLLSQKSNVRYYLHKESQKDKGADFSSKKVISVIEPQKEAIEVFEKILAEFPKFHKTKEVTYILALSLKSIDEIPRFRMTAEKLIKKYPGSKESMRARLLLGTYYFEKDLFPDAIQILDPIKNSEFPFERNSAKYRLGLIYLAQKKYKISLKYFEEIALDDTLVEEANPQVVSLENRSLKSNLKSEALIDSIRVFTNVFPKNPKPIEYYSRVAPNEILFQEVIEKLAFRYIYLKKYNFAIKILRTFTERVVDPKKVIDIYRQVLLSIPPNRRLDLDIDEMNFVLQKYNLWSSYYEKSGKVSKEAYDFFEKNIRDLGTKSHALGKSVKSKKKKDYYFERARAFYNMYLGHFNRGRKSVKIAMNLADVFYYQKKYIQSGDYYLRTFLGEFGKPYKKKSLIINSILSLQKEDKYSYYEQIRVNGLLIKALKSYFKFDKSQMKKPKMLFLLYRTQYQQGLFKRSIENLYKFMQKFPSSIETPLAGHLILDYYNTKGDYDGLAENAKRILALNLPKKTFNNEVAKILKNSQMVRLKSKVEKNSADNNYQQGQAFLKIALSEKDSTLQSVALQQALARSKSEQDMNTFFKAAKQLALKETNKSKKAETFQSLADNYLSVGKYFSARRVLNNDLIQSKYSAQIKQESYSKMTMLNFALRDWVTLNTNKQSKRWSKLSGDFKAQVRQIAFNYLESPLSLPPGVVSFLKADYYSDEELLLLYKAKERLPATLNNMVANQIEKRCQGAAASVCIWTMLPHVDKNWFSFEKKLKKASPSMKSLEKLAQTFAGLSGQYTKMEGTGDPALEIILSLRQQHAYEAFANYLKRAARKNKDIEVFLQQKVHESEKTADGYAMRCQTVVKEAKVLSPAIRLCGRRSNPSLKSAVRWKKLRIVPSINTSEPTDKTLNDLQTKVFISKEDPEKLLDVSKWYLDNKYYHLAVASANIGQGLHPSNSGDFEAILGCGVLKLGLLQEAQYHLEKASDFGNLKTSCLGLYNRLVKESR